MAGLASTLARSLDRLLRLHGDHDLRRLELSRQADRLLPISPQFVDFFFGRRGCRGCGFELGQLAGMFLALPQGLFERLLIFGQMKKLLPIVKGGAIRAKLLVGPVGFIGAGFRLGRLLPGLMQIPIGRGDGGALAGEKFLHLLQALGNGVPFRQLDLGLFEQTGRPVRGSAGPDRGVPCASPVPAARPVSA